MNETSRALPVAAIAVALCGAALTGSGVQSTNDLPNPYQTVAPWGNLPDGRKWGALNGVDIDRDGVSVWVADRCGANPDTPPGVSPFQWDSCAGSKLPPVLKFDASGNLLRSFGTGMFIFPHKISVDRDGSCGVVDLRSATRPRAQSVAGYRRRGHTVVKFSPDGKVLLTIGKRPASPAIRPIPDRADHIVRGAERGSRTSTEGHSGQSTKRPRRTPLRGFRSSPGTASSSSRLAGSDRGRVEFRTPHDIAMDGRGRLLCRRRGNNRLQDSRSGRRRVHRRMEAVRPPERVYIRNDLIYVATRNRTAPGESGMAARHPDRQPKDGKVLLPHSRPPNWRAPSAAEGVAVDAKGNVYGRTRSGPGSGEALRSGASPIRRLR